ncbi:unnamed protein product, partial [Mesorhabditis spiculigera]
MTDEKEYEALQRLSQLSDQFATYATELRKTARAAKRLIDKKKEADLPSGDRSGMNNMVKVEYHALIDQLRVLPFREEAEAAIKAMAAFNDELEVLKRRLSKQPMEVLEETQTSITKFNRSRVTIQNIPAHYTQAEAIHRFLDDGRDLIHWDDCPDCLLRINDDGSQKMIAYMQSAEAAEEVAARHHGRIENNRELFVSVDILKQTRLKETATEQARSRPWFGGKVIPPLMATLLTEPDFKPSAVSAPPDPWSNRVHRQDVFPKVAENSVKTSSGAESNAVQKNARTLSNACKKGKVKLHDTVVCIRGMPPGSSAQLLPFIDPNGGDLIYKNGKPKLVCFTREWNGKHHYLIFAHMTSKAAASNLVHKYQKNPPLLTDHKLVWEIAGTNLWSRL